MWGLRRRAGIAVDANPGDYNNGARIRLILADVGSLESHISERRANMGRQPLQFVEAYASSSAFQPDRRR